MARVYKVVVREGTDILTDTGVGEVTSDHFTSSTYSQNTDTWMNAGNTSANYGAAQDFYVGHYDASGFGVARGLVRFTFTDVNSYLHGDISREITSNLYLYVNSTTGTTNRTYNVDILAPARRFIESESTWTVYTTGNNWSTAGCGHSTDDYVSSYVKSGSFQGAGSYYSVDVSNSVNAFLNDPSWSFVTGWRISDSTETSGTYKQLASSENSTASVRPVLSISFKIRNGRKLGMWNAQSKSMGCSRG